MAHAHIAPDTRRAGSGITGNAGATIGLADASADAPAERTRRI